MRISDWSSDVCSSDLHAGEEQQLGDEQQAVGRLPERRDVARADQEPAVHRPGQDQQGDDDRADEGEAPQRFLGEHDPVHVFSGEIIGRSEEHTSELQSLMRISYAVFCLKKKTYTTNNTENT